MEINVKIVPGELTRLMEGRDERRIRAVAVKEAAETKRRGASVKPG